MTGLKHKTSARIEEFRASNRRGARLKGPKNASKF